MLLDKSLISESGFIRFFVFQIDLAINEICTLISLFAITFHILQQKINGVKVSLAKLARKAEAFDGIHSALALRRNQSILLFVHTENRILQSELSENLSADGLSLIVITVDSWPITRNGWCTLKSVC